MSLRHTRLLRIVNILTNGQRPYDQRAIYWKGQTYLLAHLERERGDDRGEHPSWDRIWRPSRADAMESRRWRNSVGRRLRRMYDAPMGRGVTTFYSLAQMQRMQNLVTPRNFLGPRPPKLTFEEFKKVWIR
jgi:hypothetical protein